MPNGYYFGMGSQADVSKALGFNQQGFQNTTTQGGNVATGSETAMPCQGGRKKPFSQPCEDYEEERTDAYGNKWCCPGPGEKEDSPCGTKAGYPLTGTATCPPATHNTVVNSKTGEKWCCEKVQTTICETDEECGAGKKCVNGVCQDAGVGCKADTECPAGQKCVNGKCQASECEGTGEAYTGCNCGKYFATTTGNCPTGYVFISRSGTGWEGYKPGAIGRCECQKWCEDGGYGSNCTGSGAGTGLGEFQWPDELQSLWKLLMGRGTDLLNKDLGYSDEAMADMFGLNFEKLRDKEYGTRQQQLSDLSRQGMLGTGAANEQLAQTSWNTEAGISDVMRELFVGNEEKKKQDLLDYTNLAQSLFGTGMSYSQILEAINSARRGEASSSYQTLISLILSMMGLS